jgi:hypothetical protein
LNGLIPKKIKELVDSALPQTQTSGLGILEILEEYEDI